MKKTIHKEYDCCEKNDENTMDREETENLGIECVAGGTLDYLSSNLTSSWI